MKLKLIATNKYLFLIDEEAEITKEWKGYAYKEDVVGNVFKHFYTTNTWYNDAKIVMAYYPLTKEAKELDLPLLPPFEDNFLKLAKDIASENLKEIESPRLKRAYTYGVKRGLIESQSKEFSLEDMIAFGKKCFYKGFDKSKNDDANCFTAWREDGSELIQSLSIQQLPKEFIPEFDIVHTDHAPNGFEKVFKFKTNSEGKKMLLGAYKY